MDGDIAQQSSGGWGGPIVRYAGALLAVVVAVSMGLWLEPIVDATVLMLIALLAAAWFSGLWPALLASVVATVALDYFFTPPLYTLTLELSHIPHLLMFALIAVLFATASAARRKAERSLLRARDELDAKVQERTADLTRTNAEAVELAGRLIHAQEQERSRIGRELHDHISQMLGVLTIRIDQLRADDGTPPAIAARLAEVRQSLSEVTDDIHGLSHRLHSSTLDYLGLVPALQKLVSEFSGRHGIAVDFAHDAVSSPLPTDVALCLFRVAEEGLTNVVKHSQARSARICVNGGSDGLRLTIADTGNGFDIDGPERRAGLGFVSMRERLRLLRGSVRVSSEPARGTTIEVWVPAVSLVAAVPGEVSALTTSPTHVTSKVPSA